MRTYDIEAIINATIETHLWVDTIPIDDNDIDDNDIDGRDYTLDKESTKFLTKDVEKFIADAKHILDTLELTDFDIGHNLALTRNHHGAGFWDMGLGKAGEELTEIASNFNEVFAYKHAERNMVVLASN